MEGVGEEDQKLFCGITGGIGKPVQILDLKDDGSFLLDETALSKILLQEEIKNLPVSIVSIAGVFRKGKSLMLDNFLRYLLRGGKPKWMGDGDEPLTGFSWRCGADPDTIGILLWSQAFIMQNSKGEKFALLLMDTQGTFDAESTMKQCTGIFALSTMISSFQIFNLSSNIGTDDLNNLHLFTAFGQLAVNQQNGTPFQTLLFLVRDWTSPYEYPYGKGGGERLLDKRLTITPKDSEEIQMVRKHIRNCFTHTSCYLMPHPGLNATQRNAKKTFDGRWNDLEPDFCRCLADFVPHVLHPAQHKVKLINGHKVKTKDILHYFKTYADIFNGNTLPQPETAIQASAIANNLSAKAEAKDKYFKLMNDFCGPTKPFVAEAELVSTHERILQESLDNFDSIRKIGGTDFSKIYREQLEKELKMEFSRFFDQNQVKENIIYKQLKKIWNILDVLCMCLQVFCILVCIQAFLSLLSLCVTASITSVITYVTWTLTAIFMLIYYIVERFRRQYIKAHTS